MAVSTMQTKKIFRQSEKGQALIESVISISLITTSCLALFQILSCLITYAVLKSYIYNFGLCELSVKPHPFFCQKAIEQNAKSLFPRLENFKYSHSKLNNKILIYAEAKVWGWIPIRVKQSISI